MGDKGYVVPCIFIGKGSKYGAIKGMGVCICKQYRGELNSIDIQEISLHTLESKV